MTLKEKRNRLGLCHAAWKFLFRAGLYWSWCVARRKPTPFDSLQDDVPGSADELEKSHEAIVLRARPWGRAIVDPVLAVVRRVEGMAFDRKWYEAAADGLGTFGVGGRLLVGYEWRDGSGPAHELWKQLSPLATEAFRANADKLRVIQLPRPPLYDRFSPGANWGDYEIEALRRKSEMRDVLYEAGLFFAADGMAAEAAGEVEDEKTESRKRGDVMKELDAKALVVFLNHPDWTQEQIANDVGRSRTYLQKLPRFMFAWRASQKGKKTAVLQKQGSRDTHGRLRSSI